MSNNPTSEKLTFLELISKHKIEIPIIQRDYAQGRDGKEELRKNFLGALYNAVVEGKPLELDFVYGSVKDGVLQPLDGQQRLTTLFLLHWFVAVKENKLNDELKNLLTKFTYETRISSRDFCNNLINKGIVYNNEQAISELIIDSSWFFLSWKRDPTIKSMLTMLDAIQQTFKDQTEAWEKLNNISFHYIELQNFGLSDDLYIKMNARGKPLTDFENFKAKFEQYIKQNNWEGDTKPTETFAHKIDTVWTDLFWKYKGDNNLIANEFEKFIAGIAISFYAENQDIFKNTDEDTLTRKILEEKKEKNITDEAVKKERIERRMTILFNNPNKIVPDDFPTKESFEYLEKCFDVYSQNNYAELKTDINLWQYQKDTLFKDIIHNGKSEWQNRVVFYAQTQYLLKSDFDKNSFNEWMRVVRNIVENSTVDSAATYISAVNLIQELSNGCCNIYEYLSKNVIQSKFANEQVKEEVRKAKLIVNDNEIKTIIFNLEDTDFCKGTINWCLECAEDNIDKLEKIKDIIDLHLSQDDISNLFRRALLTINDNNFYNYWGTWSYNTNSQKRCLIENRNDLKNSFTKGIWLGGYLKPLIIQLFDNENNLQNILNRYVCPDNMPNWKKRLIKEDSLLDNYCQNHYIGIPKTEGFCYLFGTYKRPTIDDCFKLE